MPVRAVIFDLGGVLLRTASQRARKELEHKLGLAPGTLYARIWESEEWDLAQLGDITYEQYWRRVGASLGLHTAKEISDFRREYFSGDRLDQGLVDLIRRLQSRYKIGLLSNAPDRLGHWLEDTWQIKHLFHAIVYSAEVGLAKPDPRIFRLILRRLDVLPPHALFIDDALANVETALALGMKAIRFTDTRSLKQELGKHLVWGGEESS
jgi:epoxide hydrolase-like predicted phosphatase